MRFLSKSHVIPYAFDSDLGADERGRLQYLVYTRRDVSYNIHTHAHTEYIIMAAHESPPREIVHVRRLYIYTYVIRARLKKE